MVIFIRMIQEQLDKVTKTEKMYMAMLLNV